MPYNLLLEHGLLLLLLLQLLQKSLVVHVRRARWRGCRLGGWRGRRGVIDGGRPIWVGLRGRRRRCAGRDRADVGVGVWYGMVWYGMVWHGMAWYGMVWYGMVCMYTYTYVNTCVGDLVRRPNRNS